MNSIKDKHRIITVDDEPAARQKLNHFLADYQDVTVVAEAQNGVEALTLIEEHKPTLLFLDIQMPKLDGISVASNLAFNTDLSIVFVTGYNEYAVKAFELNAVDYLLKPYDKARLAKTMERYYANSGQSTPYDMPKLIKDYRASQHYPDTLLFKAEGTIEVVRANEIQWLESSGNYVKVCLARTAFIARQTLTGVQNQLDPALFIRVHRSHIVNINEVIQLEALGKGDYLLILKSRVELRMSRAYSDELLKHFHQTKIKE